MKKILIRNGNILTASENFIGDILIEGEKIKAIGSSLPETDCEVIDASGLTLMPGGVDPHTHFDLPMGKTVSSDDHYSGHKAAAFGGTTSVMDFVSFDRPTLEESITLWQEKAYPKAAVDFSFHMNLSKWNEEIKKELSLLVKWGMPSIKVFTSYNGRLRLQDGEIFSAMQQAKELGLLTLLHAENGDVIEILTREALDRGHLSPEWHALTRPAWGAVESTLRGIALAAQSGAALYIVHMNAAGEVDQLQYGRENGLPIIGETCPQYLFFTIDHLRRNDGAKWVCSPPVRSVEDNQRLWEGLAQGIIQTIATDHCPFFYDGTKPILYEGKEIAIPGKELGKGDFTQIPNGLPGVGDRLPILWNYGVRSGKISPNQFVALTSTNPAKVFGLYPQKGALIPGADADIVIWDMERRVDYGVQYAQHRTDYNLYEGWELVGYPIKVFLRGKIIVDDGKWFGKAGDGKFIRRLAGVNVI